MSNCRITITGHKIWRDGDNVYDTRPASVEIKLLRDGKDYNKPITVNANGDGEYVFACLPLRKNDGNKYIYTVDEATIPPGYTKKIEGYNIVNTAEPGVRTITGSKIWEDNNDAEGDRPDTITVNLLQNNVKIKSEVLNKPPAGEKTVVFTFAGVPRFDANGTPFVYTVDEDELPEYYEKSIAGFNITNTLKPTPPYK